MPPTKATLARRKNLKSTPPIQVRDQRRQDAQDASVRALILGKARQQAQVSVNSLPIYQSQPGGVNQIVKEQLITPQESCHGETEIGTQDITPSSSCTAASEVYGTLPDPKALIVAMQARVQEAQQLAEECRQKGWKTLEDIARGDSYEFRQNKEIFSPDNMVISSPRTPPVADGVETPVITGSLPMSPVKNTPRSRRRQEAQEQRKQNRVLRARGHRKHVAAPKQEDCLTALADVRQILRPLRPNGKGHKKFEGDELLRFRLGLMELFLKIYTDPCLDSDGTRYLTWQDASLRATKVRSCGEKQAESLRSWTRSFLKDRTCLPINVYGSWNQSLLHGDLAQDMEEYLLGVGKHVRANDVLVYLEDPDVRKRFGLGDRRISIRTAEDWMETLRFRWGTPKKGMYIDGHERPDVVATRQNVYLPALKALLPLMHSFGDVDGTMTEEIRSLPLGTCPVVIWSHDESTWHANDRRDLGWQHDDAAPTLQQKGEGASVMTADFVSAKYGFLKSKSDPSNNTQVLFKAGAARDGYFTSDNVVQHLHHAIDILQKEYSDEDHVFVFDNATTHRKRAEDALAARKMPKWPSKVKETNFGNSHPVRDARGMPMKGADGKILKSRILMRDGVYTAPDGRRVIQPLYFPEGHLQAGLFKGMVEILAERGFDWKLMEKKRYECVGFKCPEIQPNEQAACCCRRILYSQPDFVNADSLVAEICRERGYSVIFYPKFHCELNPIEQCWGYAKDKYRRLPPSSDEHTLLQNVRQVLDAIPLDVIRRFHRRSLRFASAYEKGLDGRQAVWAAKKYHGHRTVPERIMAEFDDAHKDSTMRKG